MWVFLGMESLSMQCKTGAIALPLAPVATLHLIPCGLFLIELLTGSDRLCFEQSYKDRKIAQHTPKTVACNLTYRDFSIADFVLNPFNCLLALIYKGFERGRSLQFDL